MRERWLKVFNEAVELDREGANVTPVLHALNRALQCLDAGNDSCASTWIEKAERLLTRARLTVPGPFERLSKPLAVGALLATPVAFYFGLPRLYLTVWLRLHRGWVVEPDGTTLAEAVKAVKGFHGLLDLYRSVERGERRLRDPNPPRDFLGYLSRLDYSLWFWVSMGLAVAAATLALTGVEALQPLRMVLGSVFVLFLPGYALIEALYPGHGELKPLERLALSIGLSLAIVPLIGLALNYTPWGIRLEPVTVSLAVYTLAVLILAAYRRYRVEVGQGSSG